MSFLTLVLTSVIFSTFGLRLHPYIPCGAGPVLVTTANTAMGYLHIRLQPLRGRLGTRAHTILLLFRPPTGFGGGPTGPKMLSVAQISSVSRGSGSDQCWRYQTYLFLIRQSDIVFIAILLTRVYALWERNRFVLWGLLIYYLGFAGFAAVRYLSRSDTPSSIYRFSVGDYSWEIPGYSLDTVEFTRVHQRFVEGRVRV
jgi:hypothetical protein